MTRSALRHGAAVTGPDRVRFRVWAPAAREVRVRVGQGPNAREHPMAAEDHGVFLADVDGVPAETAYRFVLDSAPLPDPRSRSQRAGVHGPSFVVDPTSFEWSDGH